MNFSVLISIYHKEKPSNFLECLDSLINQTYLPNEIVIVKDGKLTNELETVLSDFIRMNKNIKIIIVPIQQNVGLGTALSIGLKKCNNNLVARMDTDDISALNRFELQINEFIKNPDLLILGGHIKEFINNKDNIVSKRSVPLDYASILKYAKSRNPFNHVTVMFKKDIILQAGNYRKVFAQGYEDYDLWVRVLAMFKGCNNYKNIDDTLVFVRVGKEMYKRRGSFERLGTALKFRKKLYKNGFITFQQYIFTSIANVVIVVIPTPIRAIIYKKILRK